MSLELKYRNRLHEVAREVTKRLVFIILTFLCIILLTVVVGML